MDDKIKAVDETLKERLDREAKTTIRLLVNVCEKLGANLNYMDLKVKLKDTAKFEKENIKPLIKQKKEYIKRLNKMIKKGEK